VPDLFATFPISKVRHFGGKLGQSIKEDFGVNFIGECVTIPLKVNSLMQKFVNNII